MLCDEITAGSVLTPQLRRRSALRPRSVPEICMQPHSIIGLTARCEPRGTLRTASIIRARRSARLLSWEPPRLLQGCLRLRSEGSVSKNSDRSLKLPNCLDQLRPKFS